MIDLATSLEIYLFEHPDWIPVATICEHFQIDERELRSQDGKRRIHARFAISSTRKGSNGLKHIRHATAAERLAYRRKIRRHFDDARHDLEDYIAAITGIRHGKWPHHLVDGTGNGVLAI